MAERTIGAMEARRHFGRIVQDVADQGDRFVVERHGQAVAAVVPVEVYEQWKRARAAFFERVRMSAEHARLSEDEATVLTDEALHAVRQRPM